MNKDAILTTSHPGAEMDTAIASRFGIKPHEVGRFCGPLLQWPSGRMQFTPTRDARDTLEVLGELEEQGWGWSVECDLHTVIVRLRFAQDLSRPVVIASAYSFELAVCRAALLAAMETK